jgi:hypothetical protein
VARALRAAGSEAVLIAVSGYSEKPVTTGEGSEFEGFLPKPFPKNELARLLSQLL